jgi:hypothetical protein
MIMKKSLILILMFTGSQLFAQPWKTINGDGNQKKETRTVADFSSLSSYGAIDVKIVYGHSNSIEVEADENLLPYIETNVENGKLIIQTKKNVNLKSRRKMIVSVSMTKINTLQLSGSGNIDGNGSFTSDEETKIMLSGSGNIHLASGSFKNLNVAISGSGNILVKGGSANSVLVSVSGSGNADCSDITAEKVDVKISGSGNAKVNVNKSLSANISGSGNVYYKGNATDISTRIIGSGKAIKI